MENYKNNKKDYKICNRCIMDNINTQIAFDNNGNCNFCNDAIQRKEKEWNPKGKKELDNIIKFLKEENKNKKYDCVIGISGGIDSSYCAYFLKKEYGLRMLGVHVDGGWNTTLATENIDILCKSLEMDLKVIKINEDEMNELQRAYFFSEVKNLDVPQDHLFFSELYRYAIKKNIKYFISGGNFSSESILPSDWVFNALDGKNLKSIYKKYGRKKLKTIKPLSFWELYIFQPYIKKLKKIRPLNYIDYNKEKAMKELHNEIGFKYYGEKHCESSFTRLYQEYILPQKFKINKYKAHLSSLIVANQISRHDALTKISQNDYMFSKLMEEDINNFIKKIDITKKEFDTIINNGKIREHTEFKNNEKKYKLCKKTLELIKR